MENKLANRFDFFKKRRYELSLFIVLICWFVFLALTGVGRQFFTVENFINIIRRMSEDGIAAVGLTLVIISAGIDLSIGSIMGLTGMLAGVFYKLIGLNFGVSIMLALLFVILAGFFNSFLITKLKIQPIIITLATMYILRGIGFGLTSAKQISGFPKSFLWFESGAFLKIPIPFYILIIVVIVGFIIQNKTSLGRYIFAIGGNETCAVISGVPVIRVKFFLYIFSAFLCSIAGLLYMARMDTAHPDTGSTSLFNIITAVLLGGTSIAGGRGNLINTVIGVFILTSLTSGFTVIGVSAYWQVVMVGVILVLVVAVDMKTKKGF